VAGCVIDGYVRRFSDPVLRDNVVIFEGALSPEASRHVNEVRAARVGSA